MDAQPTGAERWVAHPCSTHPTETFGRNRMRIHYLLTLTLLYPSLAQAAELELVQTIPLKGKPGGLDHLALDSKRDRLLVANKTNNTLDVVDLKAGALLKQVPNQTGIQGIAY